MKFKLELTHNITLSLERVKITKHMCVYISIYIAFNHKLWYVVLGTAVVYLFRMRRVFCGASGSYL